MQLIMSGSILFLPPYTRGEKTFRSELESNPGTLASQATALTTRPWLLGQAKNRYISSILTLLKDQFYYKQILDESQGLLILNNEKETKSFLTFFVNLPQVLGQKIMLLAFPS